MFTKWSRYATLTRNSMVASSMNRDLMLWNHQIIWLASRTPYPNLWYTCWCRLLNVHPKICMLRYRSLCQLCKHQGMHASFMRPPGMGKWSLFVIWNSCLIRLPLLPPPSLRIPSSFASPDLLYNPPNFTIYKCKPVVACLPLSSHIASSLISHMLTILCLRLQPQKCLSSICWWC